MVNIFLNKKISLLFFLRQKTNFYSLIINIIINLLIWSWLVWRVKATSDPIPLSFNVYFGIDNLAAWNKIFYLPIWCLAIILINYFFAYVVFLKNKILSNWLVLSPIFLQLFLLFFYILLIINYY